MKKEFDMTGYVTVTNLNTEMHTYIEESAQVLARRLRQNRDSHQVTI